MLQNPEKEIETKQTAPLSAKEELKVFIIDFFDGKIDNKTMNNLFLERLDETEKSLCKINFNQVLATMRTIVNSVYSCENHTEKLAELQKIEEVFEQELEAEKSKKTLNRIKKSVTKFFVLLDRYSIASCDRTQKNL